MPSQPMPEWGWPVLHTAVPVTSCQSQEPPAVSVASSVEATRLTPTVTFSVSDNVQVSLVTASSDDASVSGPFEIEDGEYAVLLDLGTTELDEVALAIEIGDDAGNVTREVVTVQVAVGSRGESQ